MAQYRHGDLLLERVDFPPVDLTPTSTRVLAEGENTGHAHRVDQQARILRDDGWTRFVHAQGPTALTHEEHARIDLPPGLYRIVRQREFLPESWQSRYVED